MLTTGNIHHHKRVKKVRQKKLLLVDTLFFSYCLKRPPKKDHRHREGQKPGRRVANFRADTRALSAGVAAMVACRLAAFCLAVWGHFLDLRQQRQLRANFSTPSGSNPQP